MTYEDLESFIEKDPATLKGYHIDVMDDEEITNVLSVDDDGLTRVANWRRNDSEERTLGNLYEASS